MTYYQKNLPYLNNVNGIGKLLDHQLITIQSPNSQAKLLPKFTYKATIIENAMTQKSNNYHPKQNLYTNNHRILQLEGLSPTRALENNNVLQLANSIKSPQNFQNSNKNLAQTKSHSVAKLQFAQLKEADKRISQKIQRSTQGKNISYTSSFYKQQNKLTLKQLDNTKKLKIMSSPTKNININTEFPKNNKKNQNNEKEIQQQQLQQSEDYEDTLEQNESFKEMDSFELIKDNAFKDFKKRLAIYNKYYSNFLVDPEIDYISSKELIGNKSQLNIQNDKQQTYVSNKSSNFWKFSKSIMIGQSFIQNSEFSDKVVQKESKKLEKIINEKVRMEELKKKVCSVTLNQEEIIFYKDIKDGNFREIEYTLLEKPYLIHIKDNVFYILKIFQETPLHWACKRGYDNIAQLLIDKGADIFAVNQANLQPKDMALLCGYTQLHNQLMIQQNLIHQERLTTQKTITEQSPLHPKKSNNNVQDTNDNKIENQDYITENSLVD